MTYDYDQSNQHDYQMLRTMFCFQKEVANNAAGRSSPTQRSLPASSTATAAMLQLQMQQPNVTNASFLSVPSSIAQFNEAIAQQQRLLSSMTALRPQASAAAAVPTSTTSGGFSAEEFALLHSLRAAAAGSTGVNPLAAFPQLAAAGLLPGLHGNPAVTAAIAAMRKREHEDDVKPDMYGKVQRGELVSIVETKRKNTRLLIVKKIKF